MITYAILNMKGGVGKTTTAINLSYLLAAEHGLNALLIDADAQHNATRTLLPVGSYPTLHDVLTDSDEHMMDWAYAVLHTNIPHLDIVPASDGLWGLNVEAKTGLVVRRLKQLLERIAEGGIYDTAVIDCPPNFSSVTAAAILAADGIIIPMLPDAYSVEGMADLTRQIEGVKAINPNVRVSGILLNQVHRAKVVDAAVTYIRENAPVPVFEHTIRRTAKVLEATWAQEPVLIWSPRSTAASDYRAWVRELVHREHLLDIVNVGRNCQDE